MMFALDWKTHAKALLWNGGMMALAFFLDFASKNLTGFGLSDTQTVILGLFLARLSKELNNRYGNQQYP